MATSIEFWRILVRQLDLEISLPFPPWTSIDNFTVEQLKEAVKKAVTLWSIWRCNGKLGFTPVHQMQIMAKFRVVSESAPRVLPGGDRVLLLCEDKEDHTRRSIFLFRFEGSKATRIAKCVSVPERILRFDFEVTESGQTLVVALVKAMKTKGQPVREK